MPATPPDQRTRLEKENMASALAPTSRPAQGQSPVPPWPSPSPSCQPPLKPVVMETRVSAPRESCKDSPYREGGRFQRWPGSSPWGLRRRRMPEPREDELPTYGYLASCRMCMRASLVRGCGTLSRGWRELSVDIPRPSGQSRHCGCTRMVGRAPEFWVVAQRVRLPVARVRVGCTGLRARRRTARGAVLHQHWLDDRLIGRSLSPRTYLDTSMSIDHDHTTAGEELERTDLQSLIVVSPCSRAI